VSKTALHVDRTNLITLEHAMKPTTMTYAELAALTGVPVDTCYGWVRRNAIPHYRYSKRVVRFDRQEIEAWIANCHKTPPRPKYAGAVPTLGRLLGVGVRVVPTECDADLNARIARSLQR
jgi:excisionase family DNA binding protein